MNIPAELYDVFDQLEGRRVRVWFTVQGEHFLSVYDCSHVRLNDTFLADIVSDAPLECSYQWHLDEVERVEDESGRLLYARNAA